MDRKINEKLLLSEGAAIFIQDTALLNKFQYLLDVLDISDVNQEYLRNSRAATNDSYEVCKKIWTVLLSEKGNSASVIRDITVRLRKNDCRWVAEMIEARILQDKQDLQEFDVDTRTRIYDELFNICAYFNSPIRHKILEDFFQHYDQQMHIQCTPLVQEFAKSQRAISTEHRERIRLYLEANRRDRDIVFKMHRASICAVIQPIRFETVEDILHFELFQEHSRRYSIEDMKQLQLEIAIQNAKRGIN